MKNTTNVQQLQAPKVDCHYNRLMKIFESIQTERIALSRDAIRSMNALQRWNCSSIIRSNATGLAKAVKAYLEKQTEIDALARKYGHENAVTIAETLLDRLHSLRVEYSREWNRLVSLAMKEKVRSIKTVQKVLTVIRKFVNHFRTPRVHRNRKMRLAIASAGSGGDAGPDADGADVAPGCSLLASLLGAIR